MRLIDADALRQNIERWENESNKGSSFSDSVEGFAYDEVLCAIDVAPTIDPNIQRPVAHWAAKGKDFLIEYYVCSRCEHKIYRPFSMSAYCPHCGAVMIGE